MRSWVTFASIIRLKSRNEGFVLRCRAGLSSFCAPGLRVSVVPPELDCPRELTIATARVTEGEDLAVTFVEEPDADAAGTIIGRSLLVDAADLPEEALREEPDVLGFDVLDERFGLLGVVSEIIEGPAQDLLVVEPGETTGIEDDILIPYVDAFIREEDAGARLLRTHIPAGLLTLGAE